MTIEKNLTEEEKHYLEVLFDSLQVDNPSAAVTKLDTIDEQQEISEIAESMTSVYTADLLGWYHKDNSRIGYMDDILTEQGTSSVSCLMMAGQHLYHEQQLIKLIDRLKNG